MSKEKSVFDWKGEPSIWLKDKQLKQIAIGQILGKNAREREALKKNKEFFIYSKAKLSK